MTYLIIAFNNCRVCSLQYRVALYELRKYVRHLPSESFLAVHHCSKAKILKHIKSIEINEVLTFHVQWVLYLTFV